MQSVEIRVPEGTLKGDLAVPRDAKGVIIFAHGSGSSRQSPRNRKVAEILQEHGLATLLFDLLTVEEERGEVGGEYRFNIELLTQRLVLAAQWVKKKYPQLKIGYFGASTGAAAALKASVNTDVFAVVSRGGRPDLAAEALKFVRAPTLLIVGGLDEVVLALNRGAMEQMEGATELAIVPGATHLFEESGKLNEVAALAANWFIKNCGEI